MWSQISPSQDKHNPNLPTLKVEYGIIQEKCRGNDHITMVTLEYFSLVQALEKKIGESN